ncbi:tetratricopeptide repeat protein 29 [Eucyclogobius newberryi]|uniref:tetratricopeptide repeat protein 29 n=1 Tax=Eucyclogobius newberryi TaxID=166745 RepID=UPI003B590A37
MKQPVIEKPREYLSNREILRVTKDLKHNLCVDMLQDGFPRSFSQFFYVLSRDQERRAAVDPGLVDALPPRLEDRPNALRELKERLTQAEHAQRSASWSAICESYLSLGLYFSATKDLWLRQHFLHMCADQEHGNKSRAATEARAHLAEICLQQGELEDALQEAELCLDQAVEGCWLDSSGASLRTRAQHALWRIYTELHHKRYTKTPKLLQRALDIAKDSGNKQIEAEATYNLGAAYQLSGDYKTAKKHLNASIKICEELDDAAGLGKAYKAVAKCLQSEGNVEETVLCLQRFTDPSTNSLPRDLVDACLILGDIYSKMEESALACEYYQRSYEGAVDLGDVSLLHKTQVLLGRAKAHSMIGQFSWAVRSASRPSLRRLIHWKDRREWDPSVQEASHSTDIETSPQQ